jgi:carbon monoxide dehydrogenase subunit G
MPGQTFEHSATTDKAIAIVWDHLDEPTTWEGIPGVDRVIDPKVDGQGRLQGFRFETKIGGTVYRAEATPAGRDEGRMMAWAIASPEIQGKITVGLEPNGAGTRVDVGLEAEGAGMLGSLLFPVISAAIGNGFASTVDSFVADL